MRGVRWLAVLAAPLFGCGGPPMETQPSPDLAQPIACGLVRTITVAGEAIPGRAVTLTVESDQARAFEVAWSVPSGTLSASTGRTVTWTLDAKIARHVAERVTARATATSPGCTDESATAIVTADWPLALRTVVVHNTKAAGSVDVAKRYAAFRKIPDEHLCAITADPAQVTSDAFDPLLDAVLACAAKAGPQVHYLVPVWGVPIKVAARVADLASKKPTTVSFDALLALGKLGRGTRWIVEHPWYRDADSRAGKYNDHVPFGAFRVENPDEEWFLVARIDGADAAAAKALVDRTEQAEALAAAGKLAGTVYVDGNRGDPHPMKDTFGSYEWGEWNIVGVETVFRRDGRYPVVTDWNMAEFGTAPAPLACPDALYYAGWYSFGRYNDVFTWKPGAIGGHLDSCSACDLRGAKDWSAVALRRGITATFGAVNEPYVAGMPDYDQFFKYLLDGATYGEAAYQSTRLAAWMMVWVGDPLYAPYRKR